MNGGNRISPLLRLLIGGGCVVLITAGMKAAAPILNVVFIALLLTQSLTPLPELLIKRRLSPNLAVSATILILTLGGLVVLAFFWSSLDGLIEKLPAYQMRLDGLRESVVGFLSSVGINPSRLLSEDMLSPAQIIQVTTSFLKAIVQALGNGFLVFLLVAFMLFEFTAMRQTDRRAHNRSLSFIFRFDEVSKDTRIYIAIVGLAGLLQASANVIALRVLDVDFAVIWGVFFFCMHLVPAVGFFFALIPPVIVALLDHGWDRALAVIVVWGAINLLFDNIIKPQFVKKGLSISITVIFLSVIYWAWVLGPIGAILAVPLTLTVRRLIVDFGKPIEATVGPSNPSDAPPEN
jgi:AI-2 transport protein TqsA